MNPLPFQRPNLLALPAELKCNILGQLSFNELVAVTGTCKSIRQMALGMPELWGVLPDVTVDQVDALDRFIQRAGPQAIDLCISDIQENEVFDVANAVGQRLPQLRSLRLQFAFASDDKDILEDIWVVLGLHAPLLERLAIDIDGEFGALPSMPDTLFLSTPPPNLVELQITAVKLEEFVPAFAGVRRVRIAAASLAQFERNSNDKIRIHFPALESLTILGIQSLASGGDDEHLLLDVPFLEEPLDELVLRFELKSAKAEPDVAEWLEASLGHVQKATLIDNRCPATCDLVLTSLTGDKPLAIHVTPAVAGVQAVSVTNAEGRSRTVQFGGPIDPDHFTSILKLPGPVTALAIPGDAGGLSVLAAFGDASSLESVAIDVDGGFASVPGLPKLGSVRALRFDAQHRVFIDAQHVFDFAANVTPAVTQVIFSKFVRVHNIHLLPVPYVFVD